MSQTYSGLLLQAFIYAQQGYLKILAEESPHFYILWIFLCEYQKWLVRQKGLEPPTYWFVASHSIQLSYQRIPIKIYQLIQLLTKYPQVDLVFRSQSLYPAELPAHMQSLIAFAQIL